MDEFRVLDLFSGIGGLSHGFAVNGFDVTGVDISESAGVVYRQYASENFIRANLFVEYVSGRYDVIVGGPPCRPWSPVNLSRRAEIHRDYHLIERFVDHIRILAPRMFILENVPALRRDTSFERQMEILTHMGYHIDTSIVRYSDYGASTSRRRLVAVGIRHGSGKDFIEGLKKYRKPPRPVRSSIEEFRFKERGTPDDHVWPNLRTISKYAEKYRTGSYGWRILKWDEPAPSFGNVMKTYILPPESDPLDPNVRVLSVLEVSRIMGFNHGFHFPSGLGVGERYQMLVDSVSPVFSEVLATHVMNYLKETES
ncbi:MAG: DNA cytosine methyltransferase [Thermoplasmataceae archaeon]